MNDYNVWKLDKQYGDIFYERAVGKRKEMESSKAVCKILEPIYERGVKVLDVGCGSGHYLRSLKNRLDDDISYVGVDISDYYVEKARDAFKNYSFAQGDIHNLKFDNDSFGIVMCNNVILHLPPPPKKAISELLRVSSDYVIIRIPCGVRNYIIKEVMDKRDYDDMPRELELIKRDGEPVRWNFLNLYTVQYMKDIIEEINMCVDIKVMDDVYWSKLSDKVTWSTRTEVIDDRQVSGNIILDWKFFVIKKVKND